MDIIYATLPEADDVSEVQILGQRLSLNGETRLLKCYDTPENRDALGGRETILTLEQAVELTETPAWNPANPTL